MRSEGEANALSWASWLLIGAMALAVLGLGALHTPVLMGVAVLTCASVVFAWKCEGAQPRAPATVLVVTVTALVLYTLLQCVPMPQALVALLDSRTADVWSRSLSPLRESGPAFHPLSLDPMATRIEVLRGVVYASAFLATLRISARRGGTERLTRGIVAIALTLAVAALLHPAFGAERVFGLYRPETVISLRHIAPLLNPNSLAAYLTIAACVTLAFALGPRPTIPVPIAAAIFLVLVAVQAWVASRGGLLTLALGVGLVIALSRATKRSEASSRTSGILIGTIAVVGVLLIALAGSQEAWEEVADANASKLTMQRGMLPIVLAHKWFGVGRGAFESAFPAFREGFGHMVFTHPEHVVIQWASEWGLLVSFVALGAIGWALRPSVVLARTNLAFGAWAAVSAVALHNLVDLSTEVPGVMLTLVVCAGVVVGGSASSSRAGAGLGWSRRPSLVRYGSVAATGLALVLAASTIGRDLYADRFRARDLLRTDQDGTAYGSVLRELMSRHPAEPYFPYAGALLAGRAGSPSTFAWAARTIELAPVYAPVHLVLARVLRDRNPSQSRLEYRLTLEQAPELLGLVAQEGTSLVGNFDDAMQLVPTTRGADETIEALDRMVSQRLPATARLLDEELLRRDPAALKARSRIAKSTVAALRPPRGPWCEGTAQSCLDQALKSSAELIARQSTKCEGFDLKSQALAAGGDAKAGMALLLEAIERVDDPNECIFALIRIATEAKAEREIALAVDKLVRAPCENETACLRNLHFAGDTEVNRGQLQRAISFYRKAYERYPESDATLERIASAASRLGLHAEALDSYARLAKRHPDQSKWAAAMAQERGFLSSGSRRP